MPSYLLCAPPIYGHVAPLVAVGRGLVARGADVTLLTGAKYREAVADAGLAFAPLPADVDFDDAQLDGRLAEARAARGVAAIRKGMIAMFVRVIPGQHRAMRALLDEGRFDSVLVESAFTGIAPYLSLPRADRLPVLGIATTPVTLTSVDAAPFGPALPPGRGPLGHLRDRALTAAIRPGLTRPLRRAVDAVLAEIGAPLSETDTFDYPYLSYDGLFQLSVADLEYPRRELPDTVRFVGPLRAARAARTMRRCRTGGPSWSATARSCTSPRAPSTTPTSAGSSPRRSAPSRTRTCSSSPPRRPPVEEVERALGGPLPANARVAEFLPTTCSCRIAARSSPTAASAACSGCWRTACRWWSRDPRRTSPRSRPASPGPGAAGTCGRARRGRRPSAVPCATS
ncbi:4'-demethylrebeccamycin synthase [Clavibacter michiganensis subsp. michiganensis]|uniref:4'-demethylrebeccamycin synthase n=1 Tax=Clavibacter michiganensis subsp. michiganensis TaxID=33013 RepID=A0A251XMN6_CLAMM|nr:4'-demethylrebeccamycin synthase [Clavibacter michiganensis subsp. michiganensis]OUE04701.1 4'-demethylrebeccamycin synthase [Clavibacter michiganensis subsp. michiganensis]